MQRLPLWSFLVLVALCILVVPTSAFADEENLRADPFTYVGPAGDCAPGYPAGSRIVTAAWLAGLGLPDNGGANTTLTDLATNPNKRDPHFGLLLSKNGPTPDCSAAGAEIRGVSGMIVSATAEWGYDIRNGSHCGGGAPRFNIVTRNNGGDTFHFSQGCAAAAQIPAPQDTLQWTRVRVLPAIPPLVPGDQIRSVTVIFDEGTDQPSLQDPNGIGLATIDNIVVNGHYIRSGTGGCDNNHGGGDNNN